MRLFFPIPFLFASFPAFAQEASGAPSPLTGILPIVLIVAIFYFLIIRPQNKKYKEHQAMIAAIKRGDKVVTGGGIHGKVSKVSDDGTLKVTIADGVEITVEQATISKVLSKPGTDADKGGKDGKESKAAKDGGDNEAKADVQSSNKRKKAANDNG